ncbi:MAG TPA: metal ABC transporter ATP-binding protein [Feifaniaceae bacterium]|nr:metal ABC transporter ATP-binding protein [Feifaniaceae bacterium]
MIKAEGLFFSYTGAAPYVLDGIDLEIKDGEYVSLVGDNGSGKSTLVRLMLRFLKPTCGSIVCSAKRIGYVPQKNDYGNSDFPITVFESLNSYRRILRVADKHVVNRCLERVGMTEYASARMGTLSGGQGQRVMIARALIGQPELLILDEPSSGVDTDSQKEIYGFLKQTNQQDGMTIVSVEHNIDAAVKNSTLIYHLSGGCGHLCSPQHYVEEFLQGKAKED